MLAPPASSDLLGCEHFPTVLLQSTHLISAAALDPKKLRQSKKTFSANTSSSRPSTIDNTLWTETPAERQKRLAEEVAGKRKRAVNDDGKKEGTSAERRARIEADEEIRRRVEEHNVSG